jgi:chromosome segregation protein
MLRLDKLEIRGFKSFCDYTEVIFHEGITAIIGPNGCGKSNIVDAVTWVLGEQSAKNLRGGKMEDVVFNGTRDRKPVGMAEVLLTLTAVADIIPRQENEDFEEPADARSEGEVPDGAIGREADADLLASLGVALPAEPAPAETADAPRPAVPAKPRRPPRSRIPTLMAGEKITIGRRLYRSGDSDYLMNGRNCRLRDIQDFFSGTGLSRAHYAIVEQGRIGQVLSSKPYDRRALIEEAAGVSRFKAKRHQAELKLEATRQNLARLNDLISEIERQIASLKRQATRAKRYRALRDELRAKLRVYFLSVAGRMELAQQAAAEALQNLTAHGEALAAQLSAGVADGAQARQSARDAEDRLASARQSAANAGLEYDRATNLLTHLAQQLEQAAVRRTEIAAELSRSDERRRLLDAALDASRQTNRRIVEELAGDEGRLRDAEAKHREQYDALQEAEREQERLRTQLLTHITRTERLRTQEEQLRDAEARLIRQIHNLENESLRAAERKQATAAELAEAQERYARTRAGADALKTALAEARAAQESAESGLRQAQTSLAELQRERTRSEDRLASLKNLDEHHTYYSSAVQTLLNDAKRIPNFKALGALADFLNVPPTYESLIENTLGDRIQAIVVPTVEDAISGSDWLERKAAGRAAFLIAGVHGGGEASAPAGSVQSATGAGAPFFTLLGLAEHLVPVVSRAYPALATAELVADLPQAFERSAAHPETLFITASGAQVLACTLLVTGGGDRQPKSVLSLKRDIRDLTQKIAETSQAIEAATAALDAAARKVDEARARRQRLDGELRETETQLAALNVELAQRKREDERAAQHCTVVASERAQLAQEQAQHGERLSQTTRDVAEAIARRDDAERAAVAVQQRVASLRPVVEKAAQELSEIRAVVAGRLERRRAAAAELRRLEQDREEAERIAGQLQFESAETSEREATLGAQRAECAAQIGALQEAVAHTVRHVSDEEARLESARRHADALEVRIAELHRADSANREARSEREVDLARRAAEYEHLLRDCRAELGENLEELRQRPADEPPAPDASEADDASSPGEEPSESVPEAVDAEVSTDHLAAAVEALKRKIENLGPINMLALEELEEAEKRHVFLTEQRADVLDSMTATEEALNEIRKRTKQRFIDAFHQINAYFTETFQELFGGGRGEMTLIDPEDILETGIDIIAQPPGKRLQSVLLLSGGEKAMAALALILAIFRYRPSPFCILDEVDAPLDEANIDRFSVKVSEMSLQTQFLVVTHNKRTMEAANSIYGVTMPEPGVSKLLSVRFDAAPASPAQS